MPNDQMTPEQEAAARKVAKLLALGTSSNENEAAAALEKAQTLLAEFNLDMAKVAGSGGADGRREQLKQKGGVYMYQRLLWKTIAELNFCLIVFTYDWDKLEKPRQVTNRWGDTHTKHYQRVSRIALIGKQVNVRSTIAMATYLEQMIERLLRERLHERGEASRQLFSRWAVSWREGITERVRERLLDRRRAQISEQEKAHRAALKRAMAGASTATALTLVDVEQQEKDLNSDFRRGLDPGTTARRRAESAAREAQREQEYAQWAAAHPEEARAKEEKAKKASDAYWKRYRGGPSERDKDWGAYHEAYDKGGKVSLDPQMGETPVAGRIGK